MVLIESRRVCAVFDPRTCDLVMVWRGGLDQRGKVHDFSQQTSRARVADRDAVLLDRHDDMLVAETIRLDDDQPVFETTLGLAGTSDAWLWFEETGRTAARFDMTSGDDGSTCSWFESACHITSDTDWQWNLKRLPRTQSALQMRVTSAAHPKLIRNMRLLRETVAWTTPTGLPCPVRWRGYSLLADGSVALRFDLVPAAGAATRLVQRLSPRADGGIDSAFADPPRTGVRLHGEIAGSMSFPGSIDAP